ncbi:MAG: hypothetical protein Q8920_01855 [Bacillota bacterium]|nr:hypothetical protein [Bacillota bacterium]
MGGSRKGIPNKTSRYDSDILPRLPDIKEWLCKEILLGRLERNLLFHLTLQV